MSQFIHDDFLLETDAARDLYHRFAASMPIIDYHCHLDPKELAEDQRWENISRMWLNADHYKWRAMRAHGVDESYVTGNASDREKWDKWAETVPYTLRNPLYHWSHMELTRYFGISELISPDSADRIWDQSCERLRDPAMSARGLSTTSNVKVICTTDDPVDDLAYHRQIAADPGFDTRVLPAWRPDRALQIEKTDGWNAYLDQLGEVTGIEINSVDALMSALQQRHDYFHAEGCRLSDHGMEGFCAEAFTAGEVEAVFQQVRSGKAADQNAVGTFQSFLLVELGRMDHAKGWVQQFHYGVTRNNNTRLFNKLGADTGFDSISDTPVGESLCRFLDRLDVDDRLAKTIVYNLDPSDNHMLMTILGNFQDGSVAGKMQHGSGWWFLDQKDGMEKQIESLSQLGLLRHFVGMLTDSRSFLSFARHEYFRRILCNILGNDVSKGLLPDDRALLGSLVQDICYNNAARYFDFGVEPLS